MPNVTDADLLPAVGFCCLLALAVMDPGVSVTGRSQVYTILYNNDHTLHFYSVSNSYISDGLDKICQFRLLKDISI